MPIPWSQLYDILELSILGQLILAAVLGGAIGWEREQSDKEAGFRTNMLICVGSTLLTILSLNIGEFISSSSSIMADPSRLIAAIISGIGFLGAGTIIQARGTVTGLTTAATMWVVAGIGIAVGASEYVIATGTTLFVLLALIPLGILERQIFEPPTRWITTHIENDSNLIAELTDYMKNSLQKAECRKVVKIDENTSEVFFEIQGEEKIMDELPGELAKIKGVKKIDIDSFPTE